MMVQTQTQTPERNSMASPPRPPPPTTDPFPPKSPSPRGSPSPVRGSPSPSPPPVRGSPPLTVMNRASRDEMAVVTKVEEGKGVGVGERDKGSRVVGGIVRRSKREAAVGRAGVGVRVAAVVLTLISFSVMAADKTKGWAGDSFDRYKEYRYCISVNVLAFAYSTFQTYAHVHQIVYGKHIIRAPFRYYFDLSLDQLLAYMLLSASSAAATRNNDWISNWGNDPFTVMINGSISMSFLAFVAFAISSLISAYNLFSRNT